MPWGVLLRWQWSTWRRASNRREGKGKGGSFGLVIEVVVCTILAMATKRFGTLAREQQAKFRSTLSQEAQTPDDDKGRRHPHLIAQGHEIENLYPGLRGPDGALQFFKEREIGWWTNSRSGDRPKGEDYRGPTRNLASSQVSCVNFLLPLADVPGALAAFLQVIDPDVIEVVPIVDQQGRSSPVEFEWVGWREPLEGGRITRGANQTSMDAVVVARTERGNRAFLLEWKYCEEYRRPKDLGQGRSGQTRRRRYRHLYEDPGSAFNRAAPFSEFLFDPYYQIMRMHLLADRMLAEGVTPDLQVTDARVVVVCPAANQDYRQPVEETPLARRFPQSATIEDVVRATLRTPKAFSVVAQEDVVAAFRAGPLDASLEPWLEYHRVRYGW